MKQISEQETAPLTCMKLYHAPVTFRPTGMLVMTSNYAPTVSNKDDDGFHRRARIWQTTQTFVPKPRKLTEHKADDSLKGRIQRGDFNAQIVWLVRGLWASLSTDVNPGTELTPKPEMMLELEAMSADGGAKTALLKFVANNCTPVERKMATKWTDFKTKVAESLCLSPLQVGPVLTGAGIQGQVSSQGARVAVGPHPDWDKTTVPGLRLK